MKSLNLAAFAVDLPSAPVDDAALERRRAKVSSPLPEHYRPWRPSLQTAVMTVIRRPRELPTHSRIKQRLERASPVVFASYAIAAAFGTYFCMYAFRKPFTAATFDDVTLWGMGYKTVLVVTQVLGYTISKFVGIKVISEMPPGRRAVAILGLIGFAHLSLLMFALVPPPYNFVFLFLNGLPLGMVFGLVLRFLEGRRLTEALAAGLCASFIVSSGFVKSTGRYLIVAGGVSDYWMPFLTGLIFVLPTILFVFMLSHIPPPMPG